MKRRNFVVAAVLFIPSAALSFASAEVVQDVGAVAASAGASLAAWKYISAALSVGISCIAGGMAVGRIGAAAMGAMSENPELSGKALPYAGLAEGICLWGFLVALFILLI